MLANGKDVTVVLVVLYLWCSHRSYGVADRVLLAE